MTIYAVAAEYADVNPTAGHNIGLYTNTTQQHWDTDLARYAILGQNTGSYEFYLSVGSSVSEAWVHAEVELENHNAGGDFLLSFVDSASGDAVVQMKATGTKQAKFTYLDTGVQTDIGPVFTFDDDTRYAIDVNVKIHGTTGRIAIYIDNILVAEHTGAVAPDTLTFNEVHFGTAYTTSDGASWSQMVIASVPTLRMKVQTLKPTSDSSVVGWSGTYTDVDEAGFPGSDFMSSNVGGSVALFGKSNLHVSLEGFDVIAVVVSSVSAIDAASAVTDNQHVVHVNATDYVSANLVIPNDGGNYRRNTIWETNPDTTNAWTQAEVNAMTYGFKAIT